MADEAIPELVLPNRPGRMALPVQGARRNPFDILNQARNGEGESRPDERVPVIQHQHVSQKQKVQFAARWLDGRHDPRVFRLRKGSDGAAEIGGNKKAVRPSPTALSGSRRNAVRDTQSMDVRHASILPPAPPPKGPRHKKRVVATRWWGI